MIAAGSYIFCTMFTFHFPKLRDGKSPLKLQHNENWRIIKLGTIFNKNFAAWL